MRVQAAGEPLDLDEDLDRARRQPRRAAGARPPGRSISIYMDPPFNTGRAQGRRTLSVAADPDGERTGFGGRRYRSRLVSELSYDDEFGDYLGFLEPRLRRARELLADARDPVLPHRLPRGPLLQAAARRVLRSRCVPQRADLGLRLRRQAAPALARQARHDPRLRAHPRRASLRRRRCRARALHGARARQRREGGARQAPDRRLVSHDRADQREREDRLPDAEAGRVSCGGWSRRRRAPAAGASIRSPARERSARSAASSTAGSCWSTPARTRSR